MKKIKKCEDCEYYQYVGEENELYKHWCRDEEIRLNEKEVKEVTVCTGFTEK